jgi:excisionase family DNA binding protein
MTDRARPHTPATLAAEWGCSARHIRNLIDNGELRAFRLGRKLLRIPAAAVEEFLCRNDTLSGDSGASAALSTMTAPELDIDTGSELMKRIELKSLRQRSTQD